MAKATKRELSKWMSGCLDELGFDRKLIWERIHKNNRISRARDHSNKRILGTDKIEKIFVGSQREGIGLGCINDTDILQINHHVTCEKKNADGNDKILFTMIQNNAPPGYTYLRLARKGTNEKAMEKLNYALVKTKQGRFLSSQLFMTEHDDVFKTGTGCISKNTRYRPPNGPSIPKYVEHNFLEDCIHDQFNLPNQDMDFVRAFPCTAEHILQAWGQRKRQYTWPSKKTIAHVMTLPVYVVAAGQRGSESQALQWRISFTIAETHLVQTLNNTQMKVLVLLKMIAKYILQPVCKDITSYTVKTVMFWLAEKTSQKKFRKKHLLSRLNDALLYLKNAVERRRLQSYMMPKKNLFANKLEDQEKKNVIKRLDYLLQSGHALISHFICGRLGTQENKVREVINALSKASFLDKIETCKIVMFSMEQLNDYFFSAFYMKYWWQIPLYNILFRTVPYIYKYGNRGLTDPFHIDLSHELAKSEKNELAVLKQQRSRPAVAFTSDCFVQGSQVAIVNFDIEKWTMFELLVILVTLFLPHFGQILPLLTRLFLGDNELDVQPLSV